MSDFSTFFPGGGGGGGSIGDYGLKPMASGANVFTDPNDSSVWFKTGHISTNTSAYPGFTPIFGKANTYPQLAGTPQLGGLSDYVNADVQYNSVEDQIIVSKCNSYWYSNSTGMYFLDPANIAGGNWGNTNIQSTTYTNARSRYCLEPVGDGLGNKYVLESNGSNTSTTTGSRFQQRTSGWLYQNIMRIGVVNNASPGSRVAGYSYGNYIYLTGIPTGPSTSSNAVYQYPLAFVATANFFYYTYMQRNVGSAYLNTYYYNNSNLNNVSDNITDSTGQQPSPSDPSKVFGRMVTVKLSKTGAYISTLTRPTSDASGGGTALIVFTDPTSTGDSFWTLDKNIFQNAKGPDNNVTSYAGYPRRSADMDYSSTMVVRKHSEDGTVIKEAGGLPVSSKELTNSNAFASSMSQQAFCTPDGTPYYFSAASFSGSALDSNANPAAGGSLDKPYNIIKLADVVGDPTPRFASLPSSGIGTQTGMGINTSNIQVLSGPTALASSPQQMYIRVL
jgi:hypothetical protein